MRQRNPKEFPAIVPDIPATVEPGEVVDWPDPIAGFVPVEDEPAPQPEPEAPAKSASKKRASAAGEEPTP